MKEIFTALFGPNWYRLSGLIVRKLGLRWLTPSRKKMRKHDADYYVMTLRNLTKTEKPISYSFPTANDCCLLKIGDDGIQFPPYWHRDFDSLQNEAWDAMMKAARQ